MSPGTSVKEIDWAELRQRLRHDGAGNQDGPATGSAAARAILDERARLLARPVTSAPSGEIDVLVLELARERYGIESRFVHSVFVLRSRAPLPGAQAPIHGVTSWRGALLTLLELRSTLGLPVDSLNDLSRVVVLGDDRASFGVMTDAVHGIVPVNLARLHPLTDTVGGHRKYLKGVTSDALLILDPQQLLRLTEPVSQ